MERFDTLISTLKRKERNQLVRSLDYRYAGSLVGRIFEAFVYERLIQGIELNMLHLIDKDDMQKIIDEVAMHTSDEEMKILRIARSSYYRINSKPSTLSQNLFNAVLIPEDPNMESVDGIFVDEIEKTLYMFQITIQKTHEVSGDGIVKVVEMAGKAEEVAKGDFELCLVFIVPEEIVSSFSKQRIEEVKITDSEEFDPKKSLRLGRIKGLRQSVIEKLMKEGVDTLGDLKKKYECGQVESEPVEKFFKPRNPDFVEKIKNIKQFSVGVKFPDEEYTG